MANAEYYAKVKTAAIRDGRFDINDATLSDDKAVVASLREVDQPDIVPVSEAQGYLLDENVYASITTSALPSAINLAARLDIAVFQTVDMQNVRVVADVSDVVADGLITREQGDAFLALKDNRRSQAQIDGITGVRPRDLGRARIESAKGLI